jgi:hypothetical protein
MPERRIGYENGASCTHTEEAENSNAGLKQQVIEDADGQANNGNCQDPAMPAVYLHDMPPDFRLAGVPTGRNKFPYSPFTIPP